MLSSGRLRVHLQDTGEHHRTRESTIELPYLPVDDVLPELALRLASGTRAVLAAPPGAGKTTRVPLALLTQPWLDGRRIIMLEPRRLAARTAAAWIARLLGEDVGQTVGYRVRSDTRVGPRTRIEVVTEGVLTRLLQQDPSLDDVAVVIFDEFHERSIHADLGLALVLQSQSLLRPELRVLVMSATLDESGVVEVLEDAAVVRSEGRAHPVETVYLEQRPDRYIEETAAGAVLRALDRHDGDVLLFLPGGAEIRRTMRRLQDATLPPRTSLMPLHGELPPEAQDRAIAPSPPGYRKVVLATAIAETSLTIEGVRVVIDSGLMRVPRFSPRTGMTRLATVSVSRAAADQRRGRAGRLGPGVCYRLWTRSDDAALLAHRPPEIAEADLASLTLELAAWGTSDPLDLRWIDPPPAAAFRQARELLRQLDALDLAGRITPHGRAMVALPIHPRLAHMLLRATSLDLELYTRNMTSSRNSSATQPPDGTRNTDGLRNNAGDIDRTDTSRGGTALLACDLAALLAERDILRVRDGTVDPDLRVRLALMRGESAVPPGHTVDRGALLRAQAEARQWRRRLGLSPAGAASAGATGNAGGQAARRGTGHATEQAARRGTGPSAARAVDAEDAAGVLLAHAYPDRIGQRRGGRGRFLLRNGRGAAIDAGHMLAGAEFLVAADVGGHGRDSRIFLAAPLHRDDVECHFSRQIRTEQEIGWDALSRTVRARERRRLGALVLGDRPLSDVPPERAAEAWLAGVRTEGLELLNWSDGARSIRRRLAFVHGLEPGEWPDVSDAALLATLEAWLLPWIALPIDAAALRAVDVGRALLALLGHARRADLDRLAPTHFQVPGGARIAIDYTDPAAPVLAVRLQEMFGLAETPRIGGGAVTLTLHLLSPARRPVQITRDLASFWRSGYFEVRKDLRGRYPKHDWPDDPLGGPGTSY
jgi:ATP-dependent helicase HrpB